ncbi:MAG: DEAD/DEAH box helicase [Trichocoleus desertorum ATA4-8-CV12]|jgi:SNF2 family DNA or RNA helicase|nr:DEAD/DEAH box helicase [Trichocoleus desertorum ATA4-8-CV12]
MAILHGSWLLQTSRNVAHQSASELGEHAPSLDFAGCFFVWGETWRRIADDTAIATEQIPEHPFAIAPSELVDLLRSLHQAGRLKWTLPASATSSVSSPPIASPTPAGRSRKRTATSSATSASVIAVEPVAAADGTLTWRSQVLALPTWVTATTLLPQHSAAALTEAEATPDTLCLSPWRVEGFCLPPLAAMQFLQALPLSSFGAEDSFVGDDLRFWSHMARWSLDLLARGKFLPMVQTNGGSGVARWQSLLDSATDQERLEKFKQHLPAVCRTYQAAPSATPQAQALDLPLAPQDLIRGFLNSTLDAQVRAIASPLASTSVPGDRRKPETAIDPALQLWLQALSAESGLITSDPATLERLETALQTWTAPLQDYLAEQQRFRTCFYLHPPVSGQTEWLLEYFLQAANDADFLLSAPTIWSNPVERLVYLGRTIERPQETLLAGLGLASRLYPLLEPSLHEQRPQFCRLTALQVYEFIKTAAWRLQDSGFGVLLPPGLANQGGWANRLGLKIQAETSIAGDRRLGLQSLLNFRWGLSIGGQTLSKGEFDRLVALNTPLVEINGEWVELRPQDIRAAQNFFAERKDQMALSLEDALRISTGDTQVIEKLPVVSFEASGALQELINALTSGSQAVEAIATPTTFKGELRPYQARGAGWLAFLERWGLGACLADDMGLGKTVELIAFLLHLQEQKALEQPTLLVCPTSVLGNWEREVKRFGPTLKVMVHHGDKRPKGKVFAKTVKGQHLIITSYALIQRDLKDLQTVTWQGVVLDEAQNIKNPEAKQSQAVRQLESHFRIALTGTPVENRLSELWSILDFLNPGYLGPKNFFQRRFAIPVERYGDTASLKTLRSLVQPFILRRLKSDRSIIQDLPEKQEMTIFCGLTAEQAKLYQQAVDTSLSEIENAEGIKRRGMILALLVKLKQICNHPTLLKDEGGGMKDENKTASSFKSRSGKLQRLEEMLEEILATSEEVGATKGDRALIFTQFAEWGKLLQDHLQKQLKQEIPFLYGSTSKKQREEMVDRFQQDPQGPRIFILSLKAGGVGLNLTRANHVFHFDRWWNPAVENQATDRVFRIGQTRNVQVHKFVCNGTLEEKIHELIESKKALAEQVVGAGEQWLTEMDTDQLRNLLLLDRSAVIDEDTE